MTEDLFKALDINLRQQPAIEGTAGRQNRRGPKSRATPFVLMAPLAHRLGAVTVTEQRGDQAGQQKWEIIRKPCWPRGSGMASICSLSVDQWAWVSKIAVFFSQMRKDAT